MLVEVMQKVERAEAAILFISLSVYIVRENHNSSKTQLIDFKAKRERERERKVDKDTDFKIERLRFPDIKEFHKK